MPKKLFIAEKPSVAAEFAKALKMSGGRRNGFLESAEYIVTWCVGHLVTMSYPEVYDPALKKWSMQTLPFLPETFLYEIIPGVKAQFDIVSSLLNREDVSCIYVCTDSGREGEYIYRLVDMMAKVGDKEKRRVWIDSQTEEEILRGIREAKPESVYDNLSASAFLRAKEDYLMGINFSRVLTLKYGFAVGRALGQQRSAVISAGRVMTCVLGMVVRREREIRDFRKTPFYRITARCRPAGLEQEGAEFSAEWKAVEGSAYFASPKLYKDNGFLKREDAEELMKKLSRTAEVEKLTRKKETKAAPLLYNLAELQNDCSRLFKISPDETLKIAQELYEKKLTTYPRTDARVLSSAVAKEIHKNIGGLRQFAPVSQFAAEILENTALKNIGKTKYVNDKAITDHYAIIPTGQGLAGLRSLKPLSRNVYELICRRFLAVFYPPAEYSKVSLELMTPEKEHFFASFRALIKEGYLKVTTLPKRVSEPSVPQANTLQANVLETNAMQANAAQANAPQANVSQAARNLSAERSEAVTPAKELLLRSDSASVSSASSAGAPSASAQMKDTGSNSDENEEVSADFAKLIAAKLRKGDKIEVITYSLREGETSPPKRYTSGSMILAMENAGQLIEDEELRAQIKGSGIGTSATRAEILKKLFAIKYLCLNEKTQVITPSMLGEMINDVTEVSIRPLLNPELTASWEKGLTYVAEGTVTEDEYMQKLDRFVSSRTDAVKRAANAGQVERWLRRIPPLYEKQKPERKPEEKQKKKIDGDPEKKASGNQAKKTGENAPG